MNKLFSMNPLLPNSRTEAMRAILTAASETARGLNDIVSERVSKCHDEEYQSINRFQRFNEPVLETGTRVHQIMEILMKYTDPKPEYDGLTAWELAGKIMEIVK